MIECPAANTSDHPKESPIPFQHLSREELAGARSSRHGSAEYVTFLKGLRAGEGGKAIVGEEGVSRQSVKNRLLVAADMLGKAIAFRRSDPAEVVFEVVEGSSAPRRRRRARKDNAGDQG